MRLCLSSRSENGMPTAVLYGREGNRRFWSRGFVNCPQQNRFRRLHVQSSWHIKQQRVCITSYKRFRNLGGAGNDLAIVSIKSVIKAKLLSSPVFLAWAHYTANSLTEEILSFRAHAYCINRGAVAAIFLLIPRHACSTSWGVPWVSSFCMEPTGVSE